MSSSAFLGNNSSQSDIFGTSTGGALQSALRSSDDDREYGVWGTASRLTISFAPDGSSVSNKESSLYEAFGNLLNAQQIEANILRAFQTWGANSSVNVGVVSDSGDRFGIAGPTQGDSRFGDIRVGAIPMAGDVFAVSVPHHDLVSGTWSGDILFNSDAEFSSAAQFFAVALHEAGHVLGLEHSVDESSAMHPTMLSGVLNGDDVSNLQSLYGQRVLDPNDIGNHRNDTMESAVEIRNNGSIDGIIPLVAFGDIENSADRDYFSVRPNSGYNGAITFRLISDSVSLLRARITVLDESGSIIGISSSSSTTGSDISFQVSNVNDGEDYFVRIQAIGASANRFGSYALVTTIDGNLVQGSELIEPVIRGNYSFLPQNEIQELFLSGLSAPIHNDLHTNETPGTATLLEETVASSAQNSYRFQAGIADATDIDYYQFEAFGTAMSVRLQAMEAGGLISDIRIFDNSLQPVSGQVLVNGNGDLLVQFQNVVPGENYFVAVSADRPGGLADTGNYDMSIAFRESTVSLENLGSGRLDRVAPTSVHTLYIARTQMFHFALTADNVIGNPRNAAIWMTVYDDQGNAVYRVATRADETRTANSVILRPGSYSIRVHAAFSRQIPGRRAGPAFGYQIEGIGISDPTGPELIDPSEDPFGPCDKNSSLFCYPDGRRSLDPFIVVDEDEVTLPGSVANPGWSDPNRWYWDTEGWLG